MALSNLTSIFGEIFGEDWATRARREASGPPRGLRPRLAWSTFGAPVGKHRLRARCGVVVVAVVIGLDAAVAVVRRGEHDGRVFGPLAMILEWRRTVRKVVSEEAGSAHTVTPGSMVSTVSSVSFPTKTGPLSCQVVPSFFSVRSSPIVPEMVHSFPPASRPASLQRIYGFCVKGV